MKFKYDSGIYLLIIKLSKETEIEAGACGKENFPSGYYYYCGSAQRNLKARIKRHINSRKKFHWHIDYLLKWAEIIKFKTWPLGSKYECKLADNIHKLPESKIIMPGFGASDCGCDTHLFYFEQVVMDENLPDKNWGG